MCFLLYEYILVFSLLCVWAWSYVQTFGHATFGVPGMIIICVVIVVLLLGTAHGNLLAVSR